MRRKAARRYRLSQKQQVFASTGYKSPVRYHSVPPIMLIVVNQSFAMVLGWGPLRYTSFPVKVFGKMEKDIKYF